MSNDLNKTTVFTFKEEAQEYVAPKDGYYYIEMAGAQGGTSSSSSTTYGVAEGGLGAKTSGYIYLEANEKLYFYIGEKGKTSTANEYIEGGYNGGGKGHSVSDVYPGASGGGSTDVRLVSGSWNDTSSLISRIMVASGGGGASLNVNSYSVGSNAGGLVGEKSRYGTVSLYGMQNSGGIADTTLTNNGTNGSFGKGGNGGADATGGGGAGYYGGAGASQASSTNPGGAGGSSYISGYAGVNSVEENTTITHTNQTLHYSGKYFIGGKMLGGKNTGNGYAKITYVDTKPKRKNTSLNNVRYIKDCSGYNTYSNYIYWVEIEAIKDGINVAKGKEVTAPDASYSGYPYTNITDGIVSTTSYSYPSVDTSNYCIIIDLDKEYDLDELAVWHTYGAERSILNNNTYVSSDGNNYIEVISEEITSENGEGRRVNAYVDIVNGYISEGLVIWYDGRNNTGNANDVNSYASTTWKDLSGTGNNVTVSGATWYNNHLSFDGSNDYAYKSSGAIYNITKEHTIEVLLKPGKVDSSYQMIFNTINSGTSVQQYGSLWISNAYQIGYDTGNGTSKYNTTRFDISNDDIEKFYLLTSVRNDRNYKLYNLNSLMRNIDFDFDARTPNPAIYIGGTYLYFKGKIYSIRVYNRALTDEEVYHNYMYDKERFNLE